MATSRPVARGREPPSRPAVRNGSNPSTAHGAQDCVCRGHDFLHIWVATEPAVGHRSRTNGWLQRLQPAFYRRAAKIARGRHRRFQKEGGAHTSQGRNTTESVGVQLHHEPVRRANRSVRQTPWHPAPLAPAKRSERKTDDVLLNWKEKKYHQARTEGERTRRT